MSFKRSSLQICRGVAVLAVGGLLVCCAQAGDDQRGRAIEFSAPKSDEITTNLNQLASKKDSLRQLEEDLYKPLRSFAPQNSLEGVVAPPARLPAQPAIQSRRARQLLECRDDWEFLTPEDLMAGPTVEDVLKMPQYDANGQEKKDLQPLERYYERLATKQLTRNSVSQSEDDDLFGPARKTNPSDRVDSQDDSDLPSGIRESTRALRQLSQPDAFGDPFAPSAARNSFTDIFGVGDNSLSKDQMAAHKKLMDEYRSVVDPGWQTPTAADLANPAPDLTATAKSLTSAASGLTGLSSPAPRGGLEAQWDVVNPMLGPAGLPDMNAQALGQTRPPPPVPNLEPPQVVPPSYAAPKRAF